MLIAANGERTEFQTGRKIEPENWDNAKQQAKSKTAEAKLLNAYLNQLRNKVYLKEIELMQRGFLITARLLRDAITDKVEALNEKTMFQVFAEHNEEQRKLVGKGLSKATYWVSEYTYRLLKEFVEQKHKRPDLFLRELNIAKNAPLEPSTTTVHTGVSRTYPAVQAYLIHLSKSERHSLHDPANQRNYERDEEEIPLESEEL